MFSMMSLKRSRGRLEGKVAVLVNGRLDAVGVLGLGNHVDGHGPDAAEQIADLIEPVEGSEATADFLETHGDVDVGKIGCLVARGGAEQRKADDAQRFELCFVLLDEVKGSVAVHKPILPQAGGVDSRVLGQGQRRFN